MASTPSSAQVVCGEMGAKFYGLISNAPCKLYVRHVRVFLGIFGNVTDEKLHAQLSVHAWHTATAAVIISLSLICVGLN